MKQLQIGDNVPNISFISTDEITSFKDLLGHNVILYFYPKDNTPGCTVESNDFNGLRDELLKYNTRIVGVSRDSIPCHQKFQAKFDLGFTLISDKDSKLCEYFNVLIEKNIFMKALIGIERSTFLIDKQGKIVHIWRKVKVKDHASEVLSRVKQLDGALTS